MTAFINKAAILSLLLISSSSNTSHNVMAFSSTPPPPSTTTSTTTTTTQLHNILRDFADYSPSRGPYSDSGAQSSNWRKNQGYTSSSTPRLFGGSYRDAETNPYYDPGWAQSTRRDNPAANFDSGSNYNGYDDPRMWRENRGYWNDVTYPALGDSYRSNKVYTNPTHPYYDPIWSQSYNSNDYEPIREEEHRMYYGAGYDREYYSMYPDYGYGGMGGGGGGGGMMSGNISRNQQRLRSSTGGENMIGGYEGGYRGGRGDQYGGYGRMNGPGRGLLALSDGGQRSSSGVGGGGAMRKWMEARKPGYMGINGNSLMRIGRNSEKSNSLSRTNSVALRMSYPIYDEFDGPFLPPPGMGGPGMMAGPGARMMEGRWGPDMRRRGRGGGGQGGPRRGPGPMGPDGMVGEMGGRGGEMGGRGGGMGMDGGPGGWGPGSPGGPGPVGFGRDKPMGRMSLKDMAARTTTSYDAEVISSMNNRNNNNNNNGNNSNGQPMGPMMNQQRAGGSTSDPTSTASQYVPLSSTYGPQATERSPPLTVGAPPPPPPIIETPALTLETSSSTTSKASSSPSTPTTVQTARSVRPSVVLVTSSGVRNENSQGSGFVVDFDDSDDNVEEVDRCYILTSAHVAPPGWKVSVTFPSDPEKPYDATVVGRKLNSDLALLSVECSIDDNDEDPFPTPLEMSSDDVVTDTSSSSSSSTSNEIGSPLYAFGYPMGLEGPTMTSGILSATTKGINYMDAPTGEEPSEISKSRPFERTSFVITDAAMAGGMSGGPLVNSEGVVLGVNALVRPDLRALGNYAVSSIECESFLERLEEQRDAASRKDDTRSERRKKRKEARKSVQKTSSSSSSKTSSSSSSSTDDDEDDGVPADGVAGYRVMLYGYSTSKAEATTILRRSAGLDELRAENAMRSAYSFGAGVVDEFYVSELGDRRRAERAAKKKAEELLGKLKEEGMMVEVEPLTLLP